VWVHYVFGEDTTLYCYIILVRSSYVISVSFGVYRKVEIVFIFELHKNRSIMLGSDPRSIAFFHDPFFA